MQAPGQRVSKGRLVLAAEDGKRSPSESLSEEAPKLKRLPKSSNLHGLRGRRNFGLQLRVRENALNVLCCRAFLCRLWF